MFYDIDLKEFPRLKNEDNDSPRINRAISSCKDGILYIPKGLYSVFEPLIINNHCSIQMHPSAILKCMKPMEFVLKYDGGDQYNNLITYSDENNIYDNLNIFIRGGDIDGNGISSCLCITNYHHFTLSDISLHNGKRYGLFTGDGFGYELIATNIYAKCTLSGLSGNIGIYTSLSDSHYTDCTVVDYSTGIEIDGSANRLTRCHVWGGIIKPKYYYTQEEWCCLYKNRKNKISGYTDESKWSADDNLPEMLINSICFNILGCRNNLDGCYADTGKIGFQINDTTFLNNCGVFNNFRFGIYKSVAIKHTSGDLYISNSVFTKWPGTQAILYDGNINNLHLQQIKLINYDNIIQ